MLEQLSRDYEAFMAGLGPEPPGFAEAIPTVLMAEASDRVGAGENWGLFDSYGSSNGPLQIQAYDYPNEWDGADADPLGDDVEAWMIFLSRLAEGRSDYVLTFHLLLLANPLEWANLLMWQSRHQLAANAGEGTYRCPDNDRGPQPDAFPAGRPDIVGCGATFTATPDDEDLVDCPRCGMWFRA